MALSKVQEIDEVTCSPLTGRVGWRTVTIISEDGVELSRAYHRTAVDADLAGEPGIPSIPPEVADVVQLARLHSPQMRAAARAKRNEQPGVLRGRGA